MNVKIIFLNRELEEEVYIIQLEGFASTDESKVCKLNRSIYELKQMSRSWNLCLDKVIKIYDFVRNEEEPCIYKWTTDFVVIFLILYVDDILLIENDILTLQSMKLQLSSQFSMKNLREASNILRMKIYRDRSRKLLGLSQSMYIDVILKRFNMKNFKKDYLSIDHEIILFKKDCPINLQEIERMSRISFTSEVRSIMHAMRCARPDVAYSLGIVSRYQSNPNENH